MAHSISLNYFVPPNKSTIWLRALFFILDHLLGIKKLDSLYKNGQLEGLPKEEFARKLLEVLDIKVDGIEPLQNSIPKSGPLVIASNHPFGGIEGVFLSWALSQVRPDLKVLVNQGLKVFPELKEFFIFTNPLVENNPDNIASLRKALKHVRSGNSLLIFPAGRVSYYQKDKKRISEHKWNKIVGRLVKTPKAQFLALFIGGYNSSLFYSLGRVYYRFRLLMLAHELANKAGQTFKLKSGTPLGAENFKDVSSNDECAQLCRSLSYAQDPKWRSHWLEDSEQELKPLAPEISAQVLMNELEELPDSQKLVSHKNLSVFYSFKNQTPQTVNEIARLREMVFRQHKEGSGEALDTDSYDDTYIHLYLVDTELKRIAGAYRLGTTDTLIEKSGKKGLYLNQMFEFEDSFINMNKNSLELGRSFLTPDYQKSYQGLYMLWKGIGAFLLKFPKYRTLYGTVSISKQYDPRSVAIIKEALIDSPQGVKARKSFDFAAHPEIKDFARSFSLRNHLSSFVSSIESDGKGIPILIKHYMGLGARFHCLGLDQNFNETPGLLLSVDMDKVPVKSLKLYLGKNAEEYLKFKNL